VNLEGARVALQCVNAPMGKSAAMSDDHAHV
jgi:hypothetical protein